MNKAILIVICDFIVLSMMTLILGLTGPQRNIGGTADSDGRAVVVLAEQLAERNAELEAARRQLAEVRRNRPLSSEESEKLAAIIRQLAQLKAAEETADAMSKLDDTTKGELTREQLKKELDAANIRAAMLEIEAKNAEEDIAAIANKAKSDAEKNAVAQAELAALREKNIAVNQELTDVSRRRIEAEKKLLDANQKIDASNAELEQLQLKSAKNAEALAKSETVRIAAAENLAAAQRQNESVKADLSEQIAILNRAKEELAKKHEELSRAKAEIAGSNTIAGEFAESVKQAQLQLSYTSGKLSTTEKELAEARGQLERIRNAATEKEIQLADAKKQVDGLQGILKKAVTELSGAKDEIKNLKVKEIALVDARQQVAVLQGEVNTGKAELDAAQEQLTKAERDLRSNVMEHYGNTVRTVMMKLSDKRTLVDHVGEHTFYLPEIEIGRRRYVIGELLTLTDMVGTNSPYTSVYELEYSVGPTENGVREMCEPLAIKLAAFDPRVALIEVNKSAEKPMQIISAEELKIRGVKDLYLFRVTSLGAESALLDGRVSLDLNAENPILIVRNAASRSSSELKARTGDFILSKQGEFVGVVATVDNIDFNTRQEAVVSLFPGDFSVEKSMSISLEKEQGGEYYSDFITKMSEIFPQIRETNRSQRKKK